MLQPGDDPFLAGAYWAVGEAYSQMFGDVIGQVLLQELTNLEVFQDGQWQPYLTA